MADKPTSKFKIPVSTVLENIEGDPLTEKTPDGSEKKVTLGMVLAAAALSDAKAEGVSLTILDRLELARRFRNAKTDPEIKVSTCEALKKIVSEAYRHSPLVAGQVLELLGEEPSKDL